ncbi:partner and localizer of BRCA2 isoform X1 [Engystomops pustulosus]|uniref:partner and localizer of BRCA2 isoform X1 n=1 Tax=Engystomops pustulosus TaxID=76066 RepID=UPI003AFB67B3
MVLTSLLVLFFQPDMDAVTEKSLSVEEKLKLKERLALLKKEYKKTVHRLQRSQRAERVKIHVKKTIEEQNRLLSQEQDSVSILTGPLIHIHNVSGKTVESTQCVITPSADKERKLSVSFNLDPEILHGEKKSPSYSGNESSGQEPSGTSTTEAGGQSNPNQCRRSRLRLSRRRTCSNPMSPSVLDRSTVTILEAGGTHGSVPDSKCLIEDGTLKINETLFTTRYVQGSPECKNDLSVEAPASPVFKKCLEEEVSTAAGLSSENNDNVDPEEKNILDTGQSKAVTTDGSPDNTLQICTEPALSNTNHVHHQSPTFLRVTPQDTTLDAICDISPVPQVTETSSTPPPCSENQSMATDQRHGESSGKEEERSPLESCTLVEGLLFPVEYYVRTTRRMTSCQRKVDLEAVIHSHLGTARKGARGRPRRASTSSTPSLQVRDTPVSTPRLGTTKSRRGRGRKSCPAAVSSGLQDISKQLMFGSESSPVETCPEDLRVKEEGLKTGANEPSSPFHLFNSRISGHHLLRHLEITDFHLPDEDFGVLKLEKLRSTSPFESFVPEKEKTRNRQASPTPATDNLALLHAAAEPCADGSQRKSKLLVPINDRPYDAPLQSTLRDNVPVSQHDVMPFVTMETPDVFHLKPSKDNEETSAPGSPVIHSLESCDTPKGCANLDRACFKTEVSKPVSRAPHEFPDPEQITPVPMESLREANEESVRQMDSHVETDPPPDLSSPTEDVTCSVLLSSSLCSVPLDPHTEGVITGCTPGFPMLGSTPAIFSSPAPCREPTSTREILPEEGQPHDEVVAPGDVDTYQCSELLIAPSGDATQKCLEEEPCSHQEQEAIARRSDQSNKELGADRLRLVSEIRDACGGGCPVDLSSVWWEFSGSTHLCIVSASEYSVRLWKPQKECEWKCVHTWNFTEMPVIQILPLFQEENMMCVALGNLEIMEIWVLYSHPELNIWERQLVKRGHTKTAQGLSRHRVVSSSGGGGSHVVELWQLAENGSVSGSHTLVAPKDSVVAFSEVDGERDALVGSTVDNNLVLWNSVTGHLLGTFYIGNLCSDLTCISATSDAGLLFLVVGSLFSKSCEITGAPVFTLIATNPQGGASTYIMAYTLPDGVSSRYLEGDVKKQRAAAVLTCGSIALWDLSRSYCSAVLPPDSETPWCLVRWSDRPSCILAGRKDGTICVFEYVDCG